MFNPFKPPAAPPAFGNGDELPNRQASWVSRLVFHWLHPFLSVGFSRPLQKDDFWRLHDPQLSGALTDRLQNSFYARCPPEKRPKFLREPAVLERSSTTTSTTSTREKEGTLKSAAKTPIPESNRSKKSPEGVKKPPKYDASLPRALLRTFFPDIAAAGLLNLFAETLKTTTPLLNKVLLTWLGESYVYFRLSEQERAAVGLAKPRGMGYGIGLAVALFSMQEIASLMTNHYMSKSMGTGMAIRSSLIGAIFRKSLRLSGRARQEHSVGNITTMISTDATRMDRFSMFGHMLWVSPIQITIGISLLISTLGYSALVGLGVILIGMPIQVFFVLTMFGQRKKGVKITDSRVRLTTEVLQGIRLIKMYSWEEFYLAQIGKLREREVKTIWKSAIARSALIATVTVVPILATVLSFITYKLSGHDLNVAVIFTSLQFFNIIRMPLVFLPMVLAALTDTLVALGRISTFLMAEELADPFLIEPERKYALEVDASFEWETVGKTSDGKFETSKSNAAENKQQTKEVRKKQAQEKVDSISTEKKGGAFSKFKRKEKGPVLPTTAEVEKVKDDDTTSEAEKPFELRDMKLKVHKGSFVAIVGRVGTGKSSLLQALTGEMRRTHGEVHLGGNLAYVPQNPWIRNATLRENVVFGQNDDEKRFRDVIHSCSLEHDIEMLPHGENTEIGEKGINLSGGQKARVSLARAAYSNTDIVLLDDPLSAVDSYVGKDILEQCILSGPLASRTRVLVTHALHVLDKTDYIYVMDSGVIVESGTYVDLMANSTMFVKLIEEYGSSEDSEDGPNAERIEKVDKGKIGGEGVSEQKKANAALMQAEERNTGFVTWTVYQQYLNFAGGLIWAPVLFILLTLSQGSQALGSLFLGFWTSNEFPSLKQGDYMAIYASLGVAQAIFIFFVGLSLTYVSLNASIHIYKAALARVLRAPTSFFDTTPMGRVLSRLSKDQDTLDTELTMTLFQLIVTFSTVLGTIALVFYTFPLLGIIFAPMAMVYYLIAIYYRKSSVETKRLDSLMRSALYASYSETLTGLSTIRAYREQDHSVKQAERGLDLENRAYYMTILIQRWLAVRLDLCGNILIFGIALFAAGFRDTVNPAKTGVVLSYTLGITNLFSEMVTQFATNEQNMNAVERVVHYTELDQEEDSAGTFDSPSRSWPERGAISFRNVDLAYREGLPLVLKDVSFTINAGEKVGIVGRTGAGKSSLLQALFRVVELSNGTIEVDGQNIRNLRLEALRNRLALVPQDSTLFLGTLRENLDPQALRTDAELISVLQRAWLLPRDGSPDPIAEAKFNLQATVGDEGSNFSAGEKQLLALSRALVKNSKIIVLDEATSSVDVETDAKLQQTIQSEFASATLLCIAHRLNTIAYYDRVLVMDGGKVAEFDTVLNLFDKADSIFRSLCDEANLQRSDILRIRAEHERVKEVV